LVGYIVPGVESVGVEEMNRLEGNLLEPILFDDWGEISLFIRDHRCACRSSLLPKFAPERRYIAECPNCGPIYLHNHAHRADAEKVTDHILSGKIELR